MVESIGRDPMSNFVPDPAAGFLGVGRSFRVTAYIGFMLSGIISYFWTPRTIAAELGDPIMLVWSSCLVVGGLLCAVSGAYQWYLVECPGIYIIITGLGLYGTALWSITLDNGGLTRITQSVLVSCFALFLFGRALQLQALAKALR